jgi:hypothetical protein
MLIEIINIGLERYEIGCVAVARERVGKLFGKPLVTTCFFTRKDRVQSGPFN